MRVLCIRHPDHAMTMVITGLMILNIQKGIYVSVATPSTVDCVTPHEFQGMSTDVTDIESSSVRLRVCGLTFRR